MKSVETAVSEVGSYSSTCAYIRHTGWWNVIGKFDANERRQCWKGLFEQKTRH